MPQGARVYLAGLRFLDTSPTTLSTNFLHSKTDWQDKCMLVGNNSIIIIVCPKLNHAPYEKFSPIPAR